MKVKDLIEKLKQFDPELEVSLADWSEQYAEPADEPLDYIKVRTFMRWSHDRSKDEVVTRLVIGDDDPVLGEIAA